MPRYTPDDLTAFHMRRGILEADYRKGLRSNHPEINDEQLAEVDRRVAAMVHGSADGQVPDDIAFVLLHNDGLLKEAYSGNAEAVLKEAALSASQATTATAASAAAAGWFPDPYRRHELRYWDGTRWTDHAADAAVACVDPV